MGDQCKYKGQMHSPKGRVFYFSFTHTTRNTDSGLHSLYYERKGKLAEFG